VSVCVWNEAIEREGSRCFQSFGPFPRVAAGLRHRIVWSLAWHVVERMSITGVSPAHLVMRAGQGGLACVVPRILCAGEGDNAGWYQSKTALSSDGSETECVYIYGILQGRYMGREQGKPYADRKGSLKW
jgi:hypothetical protein